VFTGLDATGIGSGHAIGHAVTVPSAPGDAMRLAGRRWA
jgi:hypothetical protein